ncbi:Rsm22-domain-containing protein [Panus rudis PR-1116 ss-1]|nr:Rsm22-domain-containing protein [Panus rudis PR-1116 ss-1]
MLRSLSSRSTWVTLARQANLRSFSSSPGASSSHQPNAPIELDPSFRALLSDVDLSLLKHLARHNPSAVPSDAPAPRELEVFPNEEAPEVNYLTPKELDSLEEPEDKTHRKSPAALFGSQRIGAVVLPLELQNTINRIISESDKPLLHQDAQRLFMDNSTGSPEWDVSYEKKYKSPYQSLRHRERDGTAFASVALPAHYSVIYSVLDHVKQRLGPNWQVDQVIDWGAGTGSGLWASVHSFQNQEDFRSTDEFHDPEISQTTLSSYIGIDKRDGLVSIGKRLLKDINLGNLDIAWRRAFPGSAAIQRSADGEVLALSAFMLSTLSSPIARRSLLKEIWESGADTIILIDHNSIAGFEAIADAREYLLRKGRKELDDPSLSETTLKGSHVLAPCPHDGACPLYQAGVGKLTCGFSQRLQRPSFVRKTKHSGTGHEDTGYSYVVIRRGPRPDRVHTKTGRIGSVGQRELEKLGSSRGPTELRLDGEHEEAEVVQEASTSDAHRDLNQPGMSAEDVSSILRAEAYNWPRLVFPPLKRSGHIILDGCTQEGKIMRMTIPKSQGKQPFYDARKSSWGDIFPHEPKNASQERQLPQRSKTGNPVKGQDIGKRSEKDLRRIKVQTFKSADKERRKQRRESRLAKDAWVI